MFIKYVVCDVVMKWRYELYKEEKYILFFILEVSEWERCYVIKDNVILRKNNFIIIYIVGWNENDMFIVKVIFRYFDYKVK